MAMKMRTFTASLIVASFFLLQLIAGCRAYSIRRQQEDSEDEVGVDRFFFPTDEALREFQQILVRELGLSRIPDVSKVNHLSVRYYSFSRRGARRCDSRRLESDRSHRSTTVSRLISRRRRDVKARRRCFPVAGDESQQANAAVLFIGRDDRTWLLFGQVYCSRNRADKKSALT